MRQPQFPGNGQRTHDSAGWVLCWLALVALVAMSSAGFRQPTATPVSTNATHGPSSKSLELEIVQFQGAQNRDGSKRALEPRETSRRTEGLNLDSTPRG